MLIDKSFEQEYEDICEEQTEEQKYEIEKFLYDFETELSQHMQAGYNCNDFDIILEVLDACVSRGIITQIEAEEQLTNTMIFWALEYYVMNEICPTISTCTLIVNNAESNEFVQFGDILEMVNDLVSWS